MSDRLRMTGMYSGMDTESVIRQLVSAKEKKVTTLKNDQKKVEWKQNLWQDLNKKIYSLYTGTLSSMRLTGSYALKSTKCSDTSKATVVASDTAVTGTQTLEVKKLAKSGYLTGAKLDQKVVEVKDDAGNVTGTKKEDWTVKDKIGDTKHNFDGSALKVTVGGEEKTITLANNLTFEQVTTKLREAGINASFDETNQRFFLSAKGSGKDADFTIEAVDEDGNAITGPNALDFLGINGDDPDSGSARIYGQDAEIILNGAKFTSKTNTFSINGLTINANAETDDAISITTDTDYDGIYDMVKNFISEYNEIINDVFTKYNAESASKYTMLSDEEKESMSDDEVEKWEDKIKGSLLRKDNTLSSIMNMFQQTMSAGYEINGEKMYLFNFGIDKLNYFEAEKDEKYAYHIDGDKDDEKTSTKEDKLKAAIAKDPDNTIQFFADLSKAMYDNLHDMMTSTDYRSIYKIYEDKRLQSEYDDYTKRIAEEQKKVDAFEDRWYDKFSKMEVALSKMQSNQNAVLNMLGNSN